MDSITPLNPSQQRFLQRLLASHVLNNHDLETIWTEINNESATFPERGRLGRDPDNTLSIINRSLKPAFGLEIRSVSLTLDFGADDDECDGGIVIESSPAPMMYHAVINCEGDDVSRAAANLAMTKNPHELALFRLVVEKLVELASVEAMKDDGDVDDDEDNGDNTSRKRRRNRHGVGCQASLPRIAMTNLCRELSGAHHGKLNFSQAEQSIHLFEAQGWLVSAAAPNDVSSSSRTPERRRGRKRSDVNGSAYLQLGPRSYMEFPEFLIKVGMDRELLPQLLHH